MSLLSSCRAWSSWFWRVSARDFSEQSANLPVLQGQLGFLVKPVGTDGHLLAGALLAVKDLLGVGDLLAYLLDLGMTFGVFGQQILFPKLQSVQLKHMASVAGLGKPLVVPVTWVADRPRSCSLSTRTSAWAAAWAEPVWVWSASNWLIR